MRIGSLFSGVGGLDMAVQDVFGGEHAWFSEIDPAASKVLAYRFPGVPNLGDITKIDWDAVEPVDVLCGGYPCQPFSAAGKRGGTDDERHMWPYAVEAMSALRPTIAVFENVSGHLTLGFDEVLRDLTLLDYELNWCILRASDVGAPHQRARLFLLAEDMKIGQLCGRPDRRRGIHRRASVGRVIPSTPEGCNDRQGTTGTPADGAAIRRQDLLRIKIERPRPTGCACLGTNGSCRIGGDSEDSAILDSEDYSCGYRPGISVDGGFISAPSQWQGKVDAGDADKSRAVCGEDSGSEPSWTGPCSSYGADCGLVSSRDVVGTRGRPIWSDSVRGQVPEARPNGERAHLRASDTVSGDEPGVALLPTPQAFDQVDYVRTPEQLAEQAQRPNGGGARNLREVIVNELPEPTLLSTPQARDFTGVPADNFNNANLCRDVANTAQWGKYAPAIARWEQIVGPAPAPTEPNKNGNPRLSAAFSEWLMGWPAGWVTDPAIGISRNDQLRCIGNGVVSIQAAAAIRYLLAVTP